MFDAQFIDDPYPIYDHLRAARPVVWAPEFLGGAWLINTDLRDAELENVSLSETRFVGTKLGGVKHWRVGEIEKAHFDSVDIGDAHVSGDVAMNYIRDLCLRSSQGP